MELENDYQNEVVVEASQIVPDDDGAPLSAQITRHDTVCLLGPNSTQLCRYLRVLAGVEPPSQGELQLFGYSLASMNKWLWREQRQHIGYVARNVPILSILRGMDNVMLPALYHKRMTRMEAKEKTEQLLQEIGFNGDIDQLPAYLTHQERLQLAIARATILDPAILFIEQPFYELALAEQQPIYHYLLKWTQKRALAVATHNLHLVKEVATQIIFIANEQLHHFNSWQEFTGSTVAEIELYLGQYRNQHQLD